MSTIPNQPTDSFPVADDFESIIRKIASLSRDYADQRIDYHTLTQCTAVIQEEGKRVAAAASSTRTLDKIAGHIEKDRIREAKQASRMCKSPVSC